MVQCDQWNVRIILNIIGLFASESIWLEAHLGPQFTMKVEYTFGLRYSTTSAVHDVLCYETKANPLKRSPETAENKQKLFHIIMAVWN